MGDLWVAGAERHPTGNGGTMDGTGGSRAVWHYTGDKDATAAAPIDLVPFENLVGWFTDSGAGYAPHVLWDPFTGRIAQFIPGNQSARALVNLDGGVQTNRKGQFCGQVETLFFPYCRTGGRVYATIADTPCIGLDTLVAWLRGWGVPDVWPMGIPTGQSQRNAAVWDSHGGHYGHSQVPENTHTDPGPMPDLFHQTTRSADMPVLLNGVIPKGFTDDAKITIPIPPPDGGAAGWGQVFLSLCAGFGDARVRAAVYNTQLGDYRVSHHDVKRIGPRIGIPLQPGDEKVDLERAPMNAADTGQCNLSWQIEATAKAA